MIFFTIASNHNEPRHNKQHAKLRKYTFIIWTVYNLYHQLNAKLETVLYVPAHLDRNYYCWLNQRRLVSFGIMHLSPFILVDLLFIIIHSLSFLKQDLSLLDLIVFSLIGFLTTKLGYPSNQFENTNRIIFFPLFFSLPFHEHSSIHILRSTQISDENTLNQCLSSRQLLCKLCLEIVH